MPDSFKSIASGLCVAPAGVVLSFDDYSETWVRHLPLLESLRIKTTFFITGGFLRDIKQAETRLRPLLQAGHSLGVHSFSHRRAPEMWASEGRDWLDNDVLDQARILGQLSGQPVRAFAYPNGDRNEATDQILMPYFHILRAFRKKIRFTSQRQLKAGGLVYATSIDNIQNHDEVWYNHQLDAIKTRSKFWVVASHHLDDSQWGITPTRLTKFAQLAHEKGIPILRFDDFVA